MELKPICIYHGFYCVTPIKTNGFNQSSKEIFKILWYLRQDLLESFIVSSSLPIFSYFILQFLPISTHSQSHV